MIPAHNIYSDCKWGVPLYQHSSSVSIVQHVLNKIRISICCFTYISCFMTSHLYARQTQEIKPNCLIDPIDRKYRQLPIIIVLFQNSTSVVADCTFSIFRRQHCNAACGLDFKHRTERRRFLFHYKFCFHLWLLLVKWKRLPKSNIQLQ